MNGPLIDVYVSIPSTHEQCMLMRSILSGNRGENLAVTICHSVILADVSVRARMNRERACLIVDILLASSCVRQHQPSEFLRARLVDRAMKPVMHDVCSPWW